MMTRTLARLCRMDAEEIAWRGTAAARILVDRARACVATPRWSRTSLLPALARTDELASVRRTLADGGRAASWRVISAHAPRRRDRPAVEIGAGRTHPARVPDAARHATGRRPHPRR